MLGQMGTDQSLAGPVQGGNMVVKPNQVPVGGAAMLSKALRGQADKGVGGMYVLPEQEDQTPDFMKIAKSNVMRDISGRRNQYPNNFAEEEGGIIPMLPRNLKTRPGAPETTLAYITPEEQAVLGLLNPGTPHRGPEDVPSYDEGDYLDYRPSGMGGTGYQGPSGAQISGSQGAGPGTGAIQEAMLASALAGDTGQTYGGAAAEAGYDWAQPTETTETTEEAISKGDGKEEIIKTKIKKVEEAVTSGDAAGLEKLWNEIKGTGINIYDKLSSGAQTAWGGLLGRDKEKKKKKGTTREFIETLFVGGPSALLMAGAGKMLEDFKVTPEKLRDENYLAIMKDVFKKDPGRQKEFEKKHEGIIQEAYGSPESGEEAFFKFSDALGSAVAPEGSESQRRTDPEKYYDIDRYKELRDKDGKYEGKFFKPLSSRFADTSGNLKDIADIVITDDMSGPFKQKIFNAREEVGRQKDSRGGGRPGGMGGGAGPVIEDEVTEATVEEGATTMPYTGPRTGGAEVNVPLSRRFALDPTQDVAQYKTAPRSTEDIYKYFTEGTTGEGRMLEPYGEFQKRRRKALGKEPLDFWSY
mgnify:CR=1 FL=1